MQLGMKEMRKHTKRYMRKPSGIKRHSKAPWSRCEGAPRMQEEVTPSCDPVHALPATCTTSLLRTSRNKSMHRAVLARPSNLYPAVFCIYV
jgi:hypothetical protein